MAATSDGSPSRNVSSSLLKHFEYMKPLSPQRVRWFFKEDSWKPFSGADSLKIEEVFRNLRNLQGSHDDKDNIDLNTVTSTTVRGSLYEADILDRECRPLYWLEDSVPIKRGTWFIADVAGKWEPFDEHESEVIEESHIKFVNSLGLHSGVASGEDFSGQITSDQIIHQIKLGSKRIEWHDISEVFIVNESTGSRLVQKIGFDGPRRLNRGYENECDVKDSLGPITHIVFLVHGIGQLYYEGGIVNSRKKLVKTFKRSTAVQTHSLKDDERVEFFPIEWRTNLKLDDGIISNITPNNLCSLRNMINATTMDVLYYASPLYREEIIQTVREKINFVYQEFCKQNPTFKVNGGKVSIIAHSLGSVIIHDMLTMWNSYLLKKDTKNADQNMASNSSSWWGWIGMKKTPSRPKKNNNEKEMENLMEELHNARLKVNELEAKVNSVRRSNCTINQDDSYSLLFKVENVFNIGSPLGVFLVMRGVRPRDDMEQHLLPTSVCKRTHNIYDPSDPIAYRLEPLIYSHYSTIPPVRLTSFNSKEPEASSTNRNWFRTLFSSKVVPPAVIDDPLTDDMSQTEMEVGKEQTREENNSTIDTVLRHRIDYVLEPSLVEYFSAITAHQSYWQNADFANFVIKVLVSKEEDIPSRL